MSEQKPDKPESIEATTDTDAETARPVEESPAPAAEERHLGTHQDDRASSAPGAIRTLLLLILLIIVIGGGYGLWLKIDKLNQRFDATRNDWRTRLSSGEAINQAQDLALKRLDDNLRRELVDQLKGLGNRQDELRQQLEEALFNLKAQLGREQKDWALAEVDYLLRIANRRLQLEGDTSTAIVALESADQRLAGHADPAYLPVREAIADELRSLKAVGQVDIDGLALELSALIREVDQLQFPGHERVIAGDGGTTSATGEGPVGWRELPRAIWNDLKSLLVIRHDERDHKPLLAPEQSYFLRQNLQLKLESARLALLRGDSPLFRDTLADAANWISTYFDTEADSTREALATLSKLTRIDIAQEIPDISGSLRALHRITVRLGVNIETARDAAPAVTISAPKGKPAGGSNNP